MAKRAATILAIITAGLLLVLAVGCGEDKPKVEVQTPGEALENATSAAEADLNKKIEELKKEEMTVEIISDGQSAGKWSQDGKGSWRLDDAYSTDTYTIYNNQQKKGWHVTGNTAVEYTDPSMLQMYEASGPLTLLGAYSAFAVMPRTGGSDDVWEWNVPSVGKLTVEFKGPNGVISKIVSEDATTGERSELEFRYSNVGDVPPSTFELPSNVTVQTYDTGTGGGTSTSLYPGGSGY